MRITFNQFAYSVVREHGFALPDDNIVEAVRQGIPEQIDSGVDGHAVAFAHRTTIAGIESYLLVMGKRALDASVFDVWFAIVAPAYLDEMADDFRSVRAEVWAPIRCSWAANVLCDKRPGRDIAGRSSTASDANHGRDRVVRSAYHSQGKRGCICALPRCGAVHELARSGDPICDW